MADRGTQTDAVESNPETPKIDTEDQNELNVSQKSEPKDQEEIESNFKITKLREIIQKYQDFFEDLQSCYSLPENLVSEIENLQDKYTELFSGDLVSTQNFYDLPQVSEDDQPLETLGSFEGPLEVKDPELEHSHIKHKGKVYS